jgi:hypothetical protein
VLIGQPDRQRILHRKLERLADMPKVFTEYYYKSNAITVSIGGFIR